MDDVRQVEPPTRRRPDRVPSRADRADRAARPEVGDRSGAALMLQRAIGNRAFAAAVAGGTAAAMLPGAPAAGGVVVQRDGTAVGDPSVPAAWDSLNSEFTGYVFEMARVNQAYPTLTRGRWSEQFTKLWSHVGAPGERTDAELDRLWDALIQMQELFAGEYLVAVDTWRDLQQSVVAERGALAGTGDPVDHFALEFLDARYRETAARVSRSGGNLVPEDLAPLHHVLENSIHITMGLRGYERDLARRARLDEEFADEAQDEGPGVAGAVWAVVGWDNWGEFAADVTLTVLTGGIGKIAKVAVKGTNAVRRMSKLSGLAKLRRVRRATRLQKVAEGATAAFRAVDGVLAAVGGVDSVRWVGQNWRRIARAYLTDEVGEAASGGAPTEVKNILERTSKELVGEYVSRAVGVSAAAEAEELRAAVLAFALGRSGLGRTYLKRYFLMNAKRRLAGNLVYYGLRVGVAEKKLSPEVVVDAAASVSFEMAQDFITRVVPMGMPAQVLVESARKSLQYWTADLVKVAAG